LARKLERLGDDTFGGSAQGTQHLLSDGRAIAEGDALNRSPD